MLAKKSVLGRFCHWISLAILLVFVSFSISTYFSHLSQYATADQDITLDRINLFLSDPAQPILKRGSNLSSILVGYPAQLIKQQLDRNYSIGDHLVGSLHYTHILPFAFVQVSIAILLIIACVLLLGRLSTWQPARDYLLYLLALSIALNFPMLKGLCKVLKYDCLSIILGGLSVLAYMVAKKERNSLFLALALFFSALAFIEKDTAVSVLFFIVIAEVILTFIEESSMKSFLVKLAHSVLLGSMVFSLTLIAFIPKIWLDPHEFLVIFESISDYGINVHLYQLFALLGLAAMLMRFKSALHFAVEHVRKDLTPRFIFSVLAVLFLFSIIYQENDMKWVNSPEIENQVKSQMLFAGEDAAGVTLTTLDKSAFLTCAKVFFSEIRLIFYFLPEVLIVMLLLLPVIWSRVKCLPDQRSINLMTGFCLLHLAVYAYLLIPIEAKYLTLVMYLLSLLLISFAAGLLKEVCERNQLGGLVLICTIIGAMIVPATQNAPSYLGYMNIFRSRDAEDIRVINPDDYSFWTWVGWGETSYTLVDYISHRHAGKKVTVGYDYLEPFHVPENVIMRKAFDIRYLSEISQMDDYFRRVVEQRSMDYIIISKNTANRSPILNALLKEKIGLAIYTDKLGGIEHGWVFRPSDLVVGIAGSEEDA